MKNCLFASLLVLAAAATAVAQSPTPATFVEGLVNPESVCYGPDGALYVTEIGEAGKNGDGKVTKVTAGKPEPLATGLDDPKGIVFHKDAFYVTDVTKVVKVGLDGKTSVAYDSDAFPEKPVFLNDIAVDSVNGIILVTDSGDKMGHFGRVFRIDIRTNKIETIVSNDTLPELVMPNGVIFDGAQSLIFADMKPGNLYQVRIHDKKATKIAEGMEGADGLVWDNFGRFFVTSWSLGKIWGIPRPGEKPILIGEGLKAAADLCISKTGDELFIPDMKSGTLTKLSTVIPGWEVNDKPLTVKTIPAFEKVKFTGYGELDDGRILPLRPIVLTYPNDGSNRVIVADQRGTIHAFTNDESKEQTTKVMLDISKKVRYDDKQNEEGFLGLAFHPKYKTNGELFVFYTDVKEKMTNVISRFKVKKDDPNVIDPASEEELMRIDRPFWNHDGGTLAFGPDGYLYIALGDGGAGGDPQGNGQKLTTLLGKILRIDVDTKQNGKPYGIPKDNPFVAHEDFRPEIHSYGWRNVWRFSFDRETGKMWAGEVGQNLFEEINIVKMGGNYGWKVRESLHPHSELGVGVSKDLIDPIWEYHHDLGKSITGGGVYRGNSVPELKGRYVYADYVTNRFWALNYDEKLGRVTENRPIQSERPLSTLSFGEDDKGEMYILIAAPNAKGIYKFGSTGK